MDTEKKLRRSSRVPKPKMKEGKGKIKNSNRMKLQEDKNIPGENDSYQLTSMGSDNNPDPNVDTSRGSCKTVEKVCKKKPSSNNKKLGVLSIDCEEINGSKTIDLDALQTYLRVNIKIDGKRDDTRVKVIRQNLQILVTAEIFVEQKYIKYLVKKYLKKTKLHNWIRIENGKKLFKLRYFSH